MGRRVVGPRITVSPVVLVASAISSILLVVVLLSGIADAAPPEPGPPIANSIGLRLVDAPAAAADDPRAQVYIVDHLPPGTVISRRVEITNGTADTAHVALYSGAATIEHGIFIGAAAGTQNELSTWTTVTPDAAEVSANGRTIATVTISVPADAAQGEQYGVAWAEVRSTSPNGLTQISRVGIRLYISVGSGAPPAADFTIKSLTATRSPSGEPIVIATVHNSGGRALDLSGSLQLDAGPAGLSAGPFPATLNVTLALDATEEVSITLDPQLPAGPWDATITLHSGLTERQSSANITFPEFGSAVPVPAHESTDQQAISTRFLWMVVAFLAACAAVAFAMRWRRRSVLKSAVTNGSMRPLQFPSEGVLGGGSSPLH